MSPFFPKELEIVTPYQHRQSARAIRVALGTAIVFVALILRTLGPDDPALLGVLAVFALLTLILFTFHSLTVTVTADTIRAAFGPGWIRKTVPVDEVLEARVVRNRWYHGWGIRYYGWFDRERVRGWLFNVSGFDAVEVRLRNGRNYRIGTDDPVGLLAAVRRAVGLSATDPSAQRS
jgi:hypothetical protein